MVLGIKMMVKRRPDILAICASEAGFNMIWMVENLVSSVPVVGDCEIGEIEFLLDARWGIVPTFT